MSTSSAILWVHSPLMSWWPQDVAGVVLAVEGDLLVEGAHPFAAQEGAGGGGVDVVPGQGLPEVAAAVRVVSGVKAVGVEGLLPDRPVVVLGPSVEPGAEAPGGLDDVGDAAVTAGEYGLEQGLLGVFPAELDAGALAALAEDAVAAAEGGGVALGDPLVGGVRPWG